MQFEQQRRQMRGMPGAGYGAFPDQYNPYGGPSMREPYYAADVGYDRNHRMPYAGREDFQPRRLYQPMQYQQQYDYQWRNGGDRRNGRIVVDYDPDAYSERSYLRRRPW
jgi:hypothetical protein